MFKFLQSLVVPSKGKSPHSQKDRKPRVTTCSDDWNRANGLRIIVHSLHDGFASGHMYTVMHARYLARELDAACDVVEREA